MRLKLRKQVESKSDGQATKGTRWMPRRAEAKKDVAKLRKAAVRSKHPVTRRCPNGGTRLVEDQSPVTESIGNEERTQGSEPSQYLQEKKVTTIASVAASERARA
jgi:hypothetical protein